MLKNNFEKFEQKFYQRKEEFQERNKQEKTLVRRQRVKTRSRKTFERTLESHGLV